MAHGATGLALYLSSADHKVPEFYGRASRREMLRTSDDAPVVRLGTSRYPGSVSPFSHPSTETPFRSALGHRHITPFKPTRRRAGRRRARKRPYRQKRSGAAEVRRARGRDASATGGYACCGPVGAAPARRRPAFGYSLIAIRRRRAAVRQNSVDRTRL